MKPTSDYNATHNVQSATEGGGSILRHILTSMSVTASFSQSFFAGFYPLIRLGFVSSDISSQANSRCADQEGWNEHRQRRGSHRVFVDRAGLLASRVFSSAPPVPREADTTPQIPAAPILGRLAPS